ncbi:MAG: M48 family metallopeptidase [Candidatus Edwardsbacteria bacterium]|nr:M48 family metallopeptidase [Candidatus Edwardsbacteria bacterium]
MWLIIAILIFNYLFSSLLTGMNVSYLRARILQPLPQALSGWFDEAKVRQMVDYTAAKAGLGYWSNLAAMMATAAVLITGLLPWIARAAAALPLHQSLQGLVVLYVPLLALFLAGLPASAAEDFGIEKKYGFSTITIRTWITDHVKSLLIGAVLLGLLFAGFAFFVQWLGSLWWLPAWGLVTAFSVLMIFIAPVWLAPLFNKFEPLKDEVLRDKILELAKKAKFPLAGVFQMDASKRSTHDNAYFTGLGRTRRIVFYDTMASHYTHDEILSVMGHEIGHWKLRHIAKRLVLSTLISGGGLYLSSLALDGDWIYRTLGLLDLYHRHGLQGPLLGAALFVVSILFSPANLILAPLAAWLSRRHEYQSDAYSVKLYPDPGVMRSALLKLNQKNLSNLFPHPLFVAFHYSHPPLLARLEAIDKIADKGLAK